MVEHLPRIPSEGWGVAQVEHLPSIHEVLWVSVIPSPTKKRKIGRKDGGREGKREGRRREIMKEGRKKMRVISLWEIHAGKSIPGEKYSLFPCGPFCIAATDWKLPRWGHGHVACGLIEE